MSTLQIRAELECIVEGGDDDALREFFVKNFKELPENMQKKVLLAFFEEAMEKQTDGGEIAKIQELGLKAVEEIEAFKASPQEA